MLNQFSIDEHQELLSACLQKRKANSFRLIMHTSARWDEDQLEAWGLKHVHMPVLADRKEDMGDLATFFLADFHQIYGTRLLVSPRRLLLIWRTCLISITLEH